VVAEEGDPDLEERMKEIDKPWTPAVAGSLAIHRVDEFVPLYDCTAQGIALRAQRRRRFWWGVGIVVAVVVGVVVLA